MKKKLGIIALASISFFGLAGVVVSTVSWFVASRKTPEYNLKGKSAGAYFAYGDGLPYEVDGEGKVIHRPYGISIPRHLYNLSWLQYMGQFADGQYYFEIADNVSEDGLDMDGYILPPIGTTQNPFLGDFNGKGKIITNLTISNDEAEIFSASNKHPDQTQVSYTAPEIVGLFGVVGNYNDSFEGTYDSSINSIHDLGISNATIKTTTPRALAGVCAGYVDAEISNVAVNESTIDVETSNTAAVDSANLTANISDYGTVGYCTEPYKKSIKKMEQELYDIEMGENAEFNAADDGDAQGWGGSINMKTIYNRIVSLRKTKSTNVTGSFQWRIDRKYYNNEEKTSERSTYTALQNDKSYDDVFSRYNGFNETGHEYIGSYNIYARQGEHAYGSDTGTYGDQQYLYLFGGHYENRTYNTYYEHSGRYITDGTNYLTYSGSLTNTTDSSQATLWSITTGSNKSISTTYNGTTYYLYNNNGTLGIRTSSYSSWTVSSSNSKYDIYNGNYHLTCSNGTWLLTDSTKSYITDGTNYMTCSYSSNTTGTISNTTTAGSGTAWSFSTYNGTGTISCTVTRYNTTYTYYLRNNNGTLQASTTSTNWTITSSGSTITVKNGDYYLTYDGGWKLFNPNSQTPYYIIYDDAGNYMSAASNYYVQSTTERSSALKFDYYSNGNSKYYRDLDNTNNYLSMESASRYQVEMYSSDSYVWRLVDSDGNVLSNPYGTGYLRAFNKNNANAYGTNYIMKQNNNSQPWTSTTSTANRTHFTVEYVDPSATPFVSSLVNPVFTTVINETNNIELTGPDYHQTSSDSTKTTNESRMYYSAEDTTYFPLNVEQDLKNYVSSTNTMNTEISSGHLDPKDSNTGYIISGANNRNVMNSESTLSSQDSNIRISRYAITSVDASYNKSSGSSTTINDLANSSLYTINTSGTEQTMADAISANANLYPRYNDSKTSFFQNSLASSSNGTSYTANAYVYGLHFMNSTISQDTLVNAEKVSVLGNKCDTYQFPVDCIDFNLKQKGVINFFAGTYFDGNNSFFSLHEIIRNDDAVAKGDPKDKEYTSYNTINQIKEIEEIYSNDVGDKTTKYANIYKYKGATGDAMYSVPYRIDGNQNKYVMNKNNTEDNNTAYTYATMNQTDFNAYVSTYGYTLKFKASQIGKHNSTFTTNRIYYFEFPMNPGEYCLGSVDGGTGAYLLYLDIGANAAKTQRTTIYEHFKEIRKIFEYPAGIAVIPVSTVATNLAGGNELDDTDTANFLIIAGTNGTITVTRAANDVTMARTGGLLTSAKPTMIGDLMWDSEHQQYNIHKPSDEGSTNLTSEIVSRDTVTDVRRLQYYDYNVNLDELTITHIIDTSTDGGSSYERTYYQEYANGESTTEFSEMRIYHSVSGAKYMEESDLDTVYTYVGNDESSVNNTLIFKISYQEDAGENITTEWLLELDVDEDANGHYYIFQDYVLKATLDNGSVTLTVMSLGSKTIKINTTTITQVGQTVTITPAP